MITKAAAACNHHSIIASSFFILFLNMNSCFFFLNGIICPILSSSSFNAKWILWMDLNLSFFNHYISTFLISESKFVKWILWMRDSYVLPFVEKWKKKKKLKPVIVLVSFFLWRKQPKSGSTCQILWTASFIRFHRFPGLFSGFMIERFLGHFVPDMGSVHG